jgi:hypothetical protein
MLISRDKVEKEVRLVLQHYNAIRKLKDKIISKFEQRGFLYGEINSIFSSASLMQVSDDLFYLLIVILYNTIDDESLKVGINPDKILTQIEKDIAANLTVDRTKDSIYPIIIENVNIDAEGDYSTTISLEMLSEFFDKRIIKYNPETQRPLISKAYGGKEIFLNEKNCREIEENIVRDRQIPDEITFNILATGEEKFEYDHNKKRLIIYEGAFDCSDGWHRTVSGRNAFKRKPTSKFYYKLRITNWDIDKTKAYIYQKSLGSQLDPLAKKSYNIYNSANQVVSKLNENHKFNLNGKITTDKTEIEKGNALVMFDVLFDTIQHVFDIKDNKEVVMVSNYLKDGINLISEDDVDLLDKPQIDQLWVAYIVALSKYYNAEDWKNKTMETIDKLNINALQSIEYKKINKAFINRVNEYINNL